MHSFSLFPPQLVKGRKLALYVYMHSHQRWNVGLSVFHSFPILKQGSLLVPTPKCLWPYLGMRLGFIVLDLG